MVVDRDLRRMISETSPTWLRAATAAMNSSTPSKVQDQPSWSVIKVVYTTLQHGKCAFCERKLAQTPDYRPALRAQDVEHYRPKRAVKAWPPANLAKERGLKYPDWLELGVRGASGYYRLAHHHWNYTISCPACNQSHKRDYFPIAKSRRLDGTNPRAMTSEWPYLIFPLGTHDDDPEDLIRFDDLLPHPVQSDPMYHDYWRARVTIDFFDLASEEIITDRADALHHLATTLELTEIGDTPQVRQKAERVAAELTSPRARHTACAKAFFRLWTTDRESARRIADRAADILLKRR
ncbi:hypothetical protein ACNOYE_05085 [Nannocystaceae bacterium ST9]